MNAFGVATLTPCRLARIGKGALTALRAATAPEPPSWRSLSLRTRSLTPWTVSLGHHSAREEVAHLLCEIVTRLGAFEDARGGEHLFPLTQGELADALGLSTVHVNACCRACAGDRLSVLDWRDCEPPGSSGRNTSGSTSQRLRSGRLRMGKLVA